MTLLFRQIAVLVRKDLLLLFNRRRRFWTIWRAFIIPIVFSMYVSFILRLYWPKEQYGVGSPNAVRSLPDAMDAATGGRNTLVLVNGISTGGDIDRVIQLVAQSVQSSKVVQILDHELDLIETCRSSLQGTTNCFGAVIFNSSPKEGPGGLWNYTLRADAAFGTNVNVEQSTNDAELYLLPLQRAVDIAIATVNSTGDAVALPTVVNEYPFTSTTQQEWTDSITTDIQSAITNYIAVVWYIGFVGVMYQLVGLMARERETGMSDLVESMMPNVRRWEPQLARVIAHLLAFSIAYGPGWLLMGIIVKAGLFPHTSGGILIIFFIVNGLAITSCSIFGASFFRKSQLSGISTVVIALTLGIIAQILAKQMSSATVVVLGLLFSPMTFVFLLIFLSRWENQEMAVDLSNSAPGSPWALPGIVLLVLLIVQIIMYPLLAVYIERWLYGTASERPRRQVSWADGESSTPIQLTNFKKIYQQNPLLLLVGSIFGHKHSSVVAVDDLSLTALKGQILVLVGPNGCGKSTILNAIAGLSSITGGSITIDGSGGIGLCPQKNVLWNGLTVEQHAMIFHKLKTTAASNNTSEDINKLITLCGLQDKRNSYARTLSGGQKRKLQLIMMLTGGSRVCCVDEVSGGLDPLSRRRVWDILLAERGTRTFILTTHFLDEAEYLADHMAIISKGQLKAEGSTSELKARLGNGYRFSVPPGTENAQDSELIGLSSKLHAEQTFATSDPAVALEKIKNYKNKGVKNYQVAGPTIEEVFMKLAVDEDEVVGLGGQQGDDYALSSPPSSKHPEKVSETLNDVDKIHDVTLLTGRRTSAIQQAFTLFQKRLTILRRSWVAHLAAVLIPVVAAGLVSIILKDFHNPDCDFADQIHVSDIEILSQSLSPELVVGPPDALTPQKLQLFYPSLTGVSQGSNETSLLQSIQFVNSLDDFVNFTNTNYSTIAPGGLFLGGNNSIPTFDYRSDIGVLGVYSAVFMQNAMDVLLSNQSIISQYAVFDLPWPHDTGDSLQFVFYFGLVMAAYPAFFALYPTIERLRGVRALQYSNGVRSLPLWLAYLVFDGAVVLLVSVLIIIIFSTYIPASWFYLSELFVCLFLYGVTSILLSFVISLVARSQLSAFAFSAGGQAFMLLMYLTAFFNINARSPPDQVPSQILIVHFTLGLITPIGQLLRAFLVGLNLFSIDCTGSPPIRATNPGALTLYGGPILYLIGQALFLFGLLVWSDHGFFLGWRRKSHPQDNLEETTTSEPEVSAEIHRVSTSDDGLRVLHISKSFKSMISETVTAVDDLTFGVKPGEVFALVGPNGAGKSTTISMLRGEIKPDRRNGEIYIENISVANDRDSARSHLGVCPQHDAMDQMTVVEHLRFYARVRGVEHVERNVQALVSAVGLAPFADRMGSKLSGGNKRKLSLAIALIGNPEVVLLDEPSSGMDPLAKRSMWKTLSRFVPQRSILLTTHSMEEADALADRVGVLAKHMLDVGTTKHLRQKHGHGFHIHLVLKSAPGTSDDEVQKVKGWIEDRLPGAEMERQPYHGQMRFNIPSTGTFEPSDPTTNEASGQSKMPEETSVGSLFILLEENKESLGIAFHSVSPSTFDEVFLKVVTKHGVGEDDLQTMNRTLGDYLRSFRVFRF